MDRALLACLALLTALTLADLLLGRNVSVVGTLVAGPFLASTVTTARNTAAVGALAAVVAVALSGYDHVAPGAASVRITTVAGGSALAVWAAHRRQQREQRLAQVTRIAEVAQRAILAPVPATAGPFALQLGGALGVADRCAAAPARG